jgi:DNA processing protein
MEDRGYWRHEKIAFLALGTLKGIGFRTLYKIAQSGFSFNFALRNPTEVGLGKYISESPFTFESQKKLWEAGLKEARKLAEIEVSLIFKNEQRFPEKLAVIPDYPEWIFVQGNINNLYMPAMSIVGTRKPSDDGIFLTKYLVAALARQNCVTVSGLAVGIDQTAHVESMRYGIPTVAVLGTGILENYPKGSDIIRAEILAKGGTIISEYLPTQSYSAENFVRRNRLQAALGDILFPTEWQIKSGTAHTVSFANRYGKKILNLHLPLSKHMKPELAFSQSSYGAIALEIPKDSSLLAGLISLVVDPDQVQISEIPEYLTSEKSESLLTPEQQTEIPPDKNLDNTEEILDLQLPLL